MKRWLTIGVALLLVSLLVVGCGVPQEEYDTVLDEAEVVKVEAASLQNQLNDAKSDLAKAESELAEAQSELARMQDEIEAAQSSKAAALSEISSLNSRVSSLQSQIASLRSDIAAVEARIAELNAAIEEEGAATATSAYWPTEGWQTSTPEEQDMDSAKLNEVMTYIEENDLAIESVVVVRNGYIVFEEYPGLLYDEDTLHVVHSVTKSFVSALIGIAIEGGYIEGTEQTMVDLFPERAIENLDSRKESITLKHLLTMTAGLEWNEWKYSYSDPRNDYIKAVYMSNDPVQYVLDLPMMEEPGVRWNYNGGTSHLLSALVAEATGYDTLDFAREFLFGPLGISESRWDSDRHGIRYGGGSLYLKPRDMAKFGYLYLHNGTWDGQQIVPADFVAEATRTHYTVDAYTGYGYQSWWTCRGTGVYYAAGLYGQRIDVVPELDLVVVFTADIRGPDPESQMREMLFDYIMAACD